MTLSVLIICGALVSIALAIARVVKGPFQADRIVALDVIFSSNIALTAAAAVATGRELFLDIGVGLSMVGFVATIVWARLIEASTEYEPPAADVASPGAGAAAPAAASDTRAESASESASASESDSPGDDDGPTHLEKR